MGIRDVATMLGRSVGRVREYIRGEDLPCRKDPRTGRLIFDEAEVREWMARPETIDFMRWGDRTKHGRAGSPVNAA